MYRSLCHGVRIAVKILPTPTPPSDPPGPPTSDISSADGYGMLNVVTLLLYLALPSPTSMKGVLERLLYMVKARQAGKWTLARLFSPPSFE